MEQNKCDLVLILQIVSDEKLRYGNKLVCKVIKVVKGDLVDKEIILFLFYAGNRLDDILQPANHQQVETGLIKKKSHELPDAVVMNGFIDAEKTSWEIVYVQKADKI
jgi:hypothetical protein